MKHFYSYVTLRINNAFAYLTNTALFCKIEYIIWGYSSAGRALEWHSRGQRFDPAYLHHVKDLKS